MLVCLRVSMYDVYVCMHVCVVCVCVVCMYVCVCHCCMTVSLLVCDKLDRISWLIQPQVIYLVLDRAAIFVSVFRFFYPLV